MNLFVVAFLTIESKILLVRRHNTKFGDGLYSLVGGKAEAHETARKAIHREVYEETGLRIPEKDFSLTHTLHRKGTETEFIALCFSAPLLNKESIYNKEPHKHDDLGFFALAQLPNNLIAAHQQIIECVQKNIIYSEHGWDDKDQKS